MLPLLQVATIANYCEYAVQRLELWIVSLCHLTRFGLACYTNEPVPRKIAEKRFPQITAKYSISFQIIYTELEIIIIIQVRGGYTIYTKIYTFDVSQCQILRCTIYDVKIQILAKNHVIRFTMLKIHVVRFMSKIHVVHFVCITKITSYVSPNFVLRWNYNVVIDDLRWIFNHVFLLGLACHTIWHVFCIATT